VRRPGDLALDLRALAEDRPHGGEGAEEDEREGERREHGHARHGRADAQHQDERDGRGQKAPDELHEAGAHEVPHAFDVAHDPRHEVAVLFAS
jgi:hypothetical protein